MKTDETLIAALKQDYQKHFTAINPGATSDATYRATAFFYAAELGPLLPADRDAAILDVGCGFGHFLRFCHESGYRDLSGIEIDPALHRTATAYLGGRVRAVINADARQHLAATTERYDVITLLDVIEHFDLADATALLARLREALKPGGKVLLRTPNMASMFGCYSRYIDLTHQCGYTEHSFRQLLTLAGFTHVHLHLPRWPWRDRLGFKLRLAAYLQRRFFNLQGRVAPRCFEKNIVMAGSIA